MQQDVGYTTKNYVIQHIPTFQMAACPGRLPTTRWDFDMHLEQRSNAEVELPVQAPLKYTVTVSLAACMRIKCLWIL